MSLIKTERLLLSCLTEEDAPFILELLNTPGWLQFIGDRGIRNLDDARNYILSGPAISYLKNNFGLYLVRIKDGDISIGICGLIKRDTLDDVDIGFAFLPGYTRNGYATEAAMAVLEDAWITLGIKRIVAITNSDNADSIKVLKRIGMKYEKMIKSPNDETALMLFGTG